MDLIHKGAMDQLKKALDRCHRLGIGVDFSGGEVVVVDMMARDLKMKRNPDEANPDDWILAHLGAYM